MHGLITAKKDSDDFVNIISNNDIISYAKHGRLSNYTVHSVYKQFHHRLSKGSSGGGVLYYKDTLNDVKDNLDIIFYILESDIDIYENLRSWVTLIGELLQLMTVFCMIVFGADQWLTC